MECYKKEWVTKKYVFLACPKAITTACYKISAFRSWLSESREKQPSRDFLHLFLASFTLSLIMSRLFASLVKLLLTDWAESRGGNSLNKQTSEVWLRRTWCVFTICHERGACEDGWEEYVRVDGRSM